MPGEPQVSGGALTGGVLGALAFERQQIEVEPGEKQPKADKLTIDATDVAKATVHVEQAKLSCDPDITYTGAEQLILKLAGCPGPTLILLPSP